MSYAVPPRTAGLAGFLARLSTPRSRGLRVSLLVLAVVLMSIADLLLTIEYSTSIGMAEHNPLARYILTTFGVAGVVSYKATTLGLAALIFYRTRTHRCAELGAWLCFCTLLWLTARWVTYNREVVEYGCTVVRMTAELDHRWVRLD